jgi:hypothetical protein
VLINKQHIKAMKTIILTIAALFIFMTLFTSCKPRAVYTFQSVKTGYVYDDYTYNNVLKHKVGDTINLPVFIGGNDYKTVYVDVILIGVK